MSLIIQRKDIDLILQFHESKYEGGPNVTMFCTYKPKSCKLSEITKEKHQARWLWVAIGVSYLFAISMNGARSTIVVPSIGVNDDQMYCIPNDWRSRDRKAEEFGTFNNCRFSMHMFLAKKIPFGRMYCTYTKSFCKKHGKYLDLEKMAWEKHMANVKKDLIQTRNRIEDETGSSISFELVESE